MNKAWKDPQIIIGNVARGNSYYHRESIVDTIWTELEKGNSILIVAPRRVGKTSVMRHIEDNPIKNYKTVFSDVEGIKSANELYKRFFQLILSCIEKDTRILKKFGNYLKSRNIVEFDIKGKIKLEKTELDYENEVDSLVCELDTQDGIKIILLLDELPDVLYSLYNAGKADEAASILKNLRNWRQNPKNRNILFVLAGSVGIHYVVDTVTNRTSSINDLTLVDCFPLEPSEIYTYIKWATNTSTVQYNEELTGYLAGKVQYFVPYFINLMLNEVNKIAKKNDNPVIDINIIDIAFQNISKNNDNFSDWKKRLVDYMEKSDYDFSNELLIHLAHKNELTLEIIYEKAVKYSKTDNYMDYINNLKKDGYLTEKEDRYIFVSPFLQAYWKYINPIYHE